MSTSRGNTGRREGAICSKRLRGYAAGIGTRATSCMKELHVRHRRKRCTVRGRARSTGVNTFQIRGRTRINVTNTRTLKRVNRGNTNKISLKGNDTKLGPTTVVTKVTLNNTIDRGVTKVVGGSVTNVGRAAPDKTAPPPIPIITCRVTIGKRTAKPF